MTRENDLNTAEETERPADPEIEKLSGKLYNGDIEQRIAAVAEILDAHNIYFYPVLRRAARNDPEQTVRDTVLKATCAMEDEFGEEECLAVQERMGGTYVECGKCSQDAAASGDYLNGSLNDFR